MSLLFVDSSADRVALTTGAGINDLTAVTVLMWIYPTATTNNTSWWRKDSSPVSANRKQARFLSSSNVQFTVNRNTTAATVTSANSSVATSAWQFFAFTYDETDGPRIFLGTPSAALAEMSYGSGPTVGSGATSTDGTLLWVGNNPAASPTNGFPGRIATFQYIARRLILGEMASLMWRPVPVVNTQLLMILGHNGTGTQPDWSGNGNAGTVTSATAASHPPLGPMFGFGPRLPYIVAAPSFLPAWARGSNQLLGGGLLAA